MFLRQSTSQVIRFGPCLDATDGVTEETGLTLAQADMRLSKDGGAFAQKNATGNATHDSDGWYSTTFDTTDTATVGELRLNVHQAANMLPVWDRWWVIEEAIYDDLFAASAAGYNKTTPLTAAQVNAEVDTALVDIELDHLIAVADDDAPVDGSLIAMIGSVSEDWSTFVSQTDSLEGIRNLTAGTNASVNDMVASVAAIENTNKGVEMVTDLIATVTSQTQFILTLTFKLWDNDAFNGCRAVFIDATSIGDQKSVRHITDYDGVTKTITVDAAPDFTIVAGDTVTILSDLGGRVLDRLPTALIGGRMDSDLEAINNDTDAADKLSAHALETLPVTFSAGGITTKAVLNQVDGAAASATDDKYQGRILLFNNGTLDHEVAEILRYDGATLTATISEVTAAVDATHTARMV